MKTRKLTDEAKAAIRRMLPKDSILFKLMLGYDAADLDKYSAEIRQLAWEVLRGRGYEVNLDGKIRDRYAI